MNADWYEDPLGRFDGRFFDGEAWTARVSADGILKIDEDFARRDDLAAATTEFESEPASPAVESLVSRKPKQQVSTANESPTRTVAVLDPALVHNLAVPEQRSPSWRLWLGLAAAAVALAVVLLVVLRQADSTAATNDLSDSQEARVGDLVDSGLDPQIDPELETQQLQEVELGSDATSSQAIRVGQLMVGNGTVVLRDLEEWHRESAAARGVKLGPHASCWFGLRDGASDGKVHCGPVTSIDAATLLFDSVPIEFDDANEIEAGKIARSAIGDVVIDARLDEGVSLVGGSASASPPPLTADPSRGARGSN